MTATELGFLQEEEERPSGSFEKAERERKRETEREVDREARADR